MNTLPWEKAGFWQRVVNITRSKRPCKRSVRFQSIISSFPGTESRGVLKIGGRYTHGPVRLDAGVFVGMTTLDPTVGFTAGFTYVFNAFTIP